jgi:hypothetical protein
MGKRPGALTIHACTKSMAATSFRTVTVAVMSRCRYHAARRSGQRFAYIATTLQHTKKQELRNVSLLGIIGNARASGLTPRAYHKQWEIRNPLGTGQRRTQSTCRSGLHREQVMPARLARTCSALRGGGTLETGPSIFGT